MTSGSLPDTYAGARAMITGGLGLIGSAIARRLVSFGAEVLLVDSMIPDYGGNLANVADIRDRVTVNIADIRETGNPHVMTEGYVSEVMVNDEDGDLSFKLVNDLGRPGPFIVCEIIDPIKLAPPSVGSRVRVYGVSRYDGQADHNWYEVHPVLNIEVVHR